MFFEEPRPNFTFLYGTERTLVDLGIFLRRDGEFVLRASRAHCRSSGPVWTLTSLVADPARRH